MRADMTKNKLVLIELNEVPLTVLEAYAKHRSPFFRKFLANSRKLITYTPDSIQLDPWIAWPTLHRGVPDDMHGLLRLGQSTSESDKKYPPVWRVLRDAGITTGVYGSLFSSCEEDHCGYAFFVPDVFSPHDRVLPADLQKFQSFNLAMTRASGRNASASVASGGTRVMAEMALKGWLTAGTVSRAAAQVVSERRNPRLVSRRRNTQTELHADIFAHLLKKNSPKFSTFYTNNVAAAMHRFWSAGVPGAQLNVARLDPDWLNSYSDEVFLALQSVERLIVRLTSGEFGPVTVMVASALGQQEIPAENHADFVTIGDLTRFVGTLVGEQGGAFETYPTMVPDFTIRFEHQQVASRFMERLAQVRIGNVEPVETFERMLQKEFVPYDSRISYLKHEYAGDKHFKHAFTYKASDELTVHLSLQIDDYAGIERITIGNESYDFRDAGVARVRHEEGVNCTAQHCAEGVLIINGSERGDVISTISTLDIAPSILSYFDVEIPPQMLGRADIFRPIVTQAVAA